MAGSRSFVFLLLVVGIIGVHSYKNVENYFDTDIDDGEEFPRAGTNLDSDGQTKYYYYNVENDSKSDDGPSDNSNQLEKRNVDPKELAAIRKELREARERVAERARQNEGNVARGRETIFDRLDALRGQTENAGNALRNMPMEFPGLNNNNW